MILKKRRIAISLLCLFTLLLGLHACARPKWQKLKVGDFQRRYLVVEPDNPDDTPLPVILCFHGGGGSARPMARAGYAKFAKEHGFLTVFPNGLDRHWEDGRTEHPKYNPKVDEIAFIKALLKDLEKKYNVDPNAVFAMGVSNGGMMSHTLAAAMSDKIRGIAPIIGGVNVQLSKAFQPTHPLSVMVIQGTQDPLVPYSGGPISLGRKKRGSIISTQDALQLWKEHLGTRIATTSTLPDRADDGCTVDVTTWSSPKSTERVQLVKVVGGGHTVPGNPNILPERIVGTQCMDFDAVDLIADFFKETLNR